ncbi:acyltransferase domain-containing protein, partial [Streptomyces sp. HB132]|uniref:acyltransferase domain-containing protein n=1 Tax=Streptomyces sp. HB132 TaxID=767388 RepID=UPI001EF9B51B
MGEFVAGVGSGVGVGDVGWSLVSSRAVLEHRAVVLAGGCEGFVGGLGAVAAGVPAAGVVSGVVSGGVGRVVFVFPGQGSQWVGMASGLLESSPVFLESVVRCGEALAPFVGWDLLEVLRGGGSLERVDVVQPVLWAVMVSLAEVWRSVGVVPSVVVGHSQGEIAAACVSGALSLSDGARLVALRSAVIGRGLAGLGGMVSVGASVERVGELLAGREGVWVAVVNGPGSTVVAGGVEELAGVRAAAEAVGVRVRVIAVDYASHTPHVEGVREELFELASGVSPGVGEVAMYSTVTAGLVEGEVLDAGYWYRNLREPVRFEETVRGLLDEGDAVFVEVSPHPVLMGALQEIGDDVLAVGTLRRGEGGPERFMASMAELWVQGVEL